MEEKELQDLLKQVQEASKKAADEASKEAIATLQKQVEDLANANKDLKAEEIKEEIGRIAGELKALKEQPSKTVNEKGFSTMEEAVYFALKGKSEEIKAYANALKAGQKPDPISIEIKESGESTTTAGLFNTIEAGETQVTISEFTGEITTSLKRSVKYFAHVSTGPIGGSFAIWIEQVDENGKPLPVGEGKKKPLANRLFEEKNAKVKKIAVASKLTTELLEDLPQLVSAIVDVFRQDFDIEVEDQMFNGLGTGVNPQGAFGLATAFTGGSNAGQISDPNELDVLESLALQVKEAEGQPEAVFIHPSTMSKIKLIKDQVGRPVWKDYVTIKEGTERFVISGLVVEETTAVSAGDFIGGQTSFLKVRFRTGVRIRFGETEDDMLTNKETFVIEQRLVQYASANHTPAIIKGDFATAKGLIEATS